VNVDPFIEAERAQQHNVTRVCQLLKVPRAAYYTRRAGSASAHQQVDKQLTEHIRAAHTTSKGRYGEVLLTQ
jgi:putative transposase